MVELVAQDEYGQEIIREPVPDGGARAAIRRARALVRSRRAEKVDMIYTASDGKVMSWGHWYRNEEGYVTDDSAED